MEITVQNSEPEGVGRPAFAETIRTPAAVASVRELPRQPARASLLANLFECPKQTIRTSLNVWRLTPPLGPPLRKLSVLACTVAYE